MELRQLRSFLKVVELQSFSKAAKALGYSQSAMSVQIRELETELGVRLFDRLGKCVRVTSHGEELAQEAMPLLQEVEALGERMRNTPREEVLHLGMIDSLCEAKMPSVMEYFSRRYPRIHVKVTIDSPQNLLERLNHNEIDLAYILDQPVYDVKWVRALEEPENIVFVCSRRSPLALEKEVTLNQLLGQRFFLTEKDDNYRRCLDQYLAAQGIALNPFLEVSDTGFILDMVQRNMGLSFLPQYVVENSVFRSKLKILTLSDYQLQLSRQLFYHRDKWLTPAMKVVLGMPQFRGAKQAGKEGKTPVETLA